ncbi:MAG: dienelactone hydrolase family protein [Alphaproteobacteria bacterium]|nr:dienelactone hydrolase family protein [Alphaproteobacteria bacterium]MCW5739478.1 dienelactone hydrolase family protein [Alphaproteobacteria bacterium]
MGDLDLTAEIERLAFETLTPVAPLAPPAATVTARLFRPDGHARPAPAMVILSSSAGVQRHRELYYARRLAEAGVAACVVDSFGPRGVRSTVADQSRVSAFQMECDAVAALRLLREDPAIDGGRIGVMGVSKGGVAAINSAIAVRRAWRGVDDDFALHVGICPGCVAQHRNATTTGRPVFFMLARHDDYTPARFAIDYAQRMRAAGNSAIRVKVYMAHHGWESIGPVYAIANAQNYSRCANLIEDDGRHFVAAAGRAMSEAEYRQWVRDNNLLDFGAHAGGGSASLRDRATEDLLGFLAVHGFRQ